MTSPVPVLLIHVSFLDALVLGAPVLEPDLDLGLAQPQALSQLTAPAQTVVQGLPHEIVFCARCSYFRDKEGILFFFLLFFNVRYSSLLHLAPLRFHCIRGCWDRTQDCCNFGIDSQTL
jgi:hypothetical protein